MEAARTPVPLGPRLARRARALPDTRLASRIRAGDERAFDALYDRYHRQLLAFCRHMLGTREEAEDALQQVFVAAHRHLSSGAHVAELRPWLYTVARNRCLSVLRARRDAVALDDVPERGTGGLALAAEVEQRHDLQHVLADLGRLPDDQRAALVLSELEDLSHDEVAAVLGVRREKVKALVFQARESLAGWRQARDADCRAIREQLATLRGGALRRGPLRRHVEACQGCRAFRDEVRRQRAAMAALLPVVPSITLKAQVMGAVAADAGLGAAAGAGAAGVAVGLAGGTAASSSAGGALAALGSGVAGKALVVAALAGTTGGGYALVEDREAQRLAPVGPGLAPLVVPSSAPASAGRTPASAPAAVGTIPSSAGRTPSSAGRTPSSAPSDRSAGAGRDRTARRTDRARAAEGRSSHPDRGRPDGAGRPERPGAHGRDRAPKARGGERRATPDPGARGGGAAAQRGATPGSARRPERGPPEGARGPGTAPPGHARPNRPARPVRPVAPATVPERPDKTASGPRREAPHLPAD